MRYVVTAIGILVSFGLIIVSMMMNVRFGQTLGTTELDKQIYGLASGCADGFKIILPFTAAWAWHHHRYLVTLASILLFVIFTAYSLSSSLGFSATNRAETDGIRTKIMTDYKDMRSALSRMRQQRKDLPSSRPILTLDALMRAKQQHRRWSSSKRCTNATVGLSRQFCENYFGQKAELATARQAVKLDAEIEQIRLRLHRFDGTAASKGRVSPQIKLLKDLLGLSNERVELILTIILTLLVEVGSGLGMFVTLGHGQKKRNNNQHPSSPSMKILEPPASPMIEQAPITDQDWASQRLLRDPTTQTALAELYQDYCSWCQIQRRTDPMTLTAFSNWFISVGFEDTKRIEGRVCFVGVRMK